MLTPSVSYLSALRWPEAPVKGLPRHVTSTSANPAAWIVAMYSPSRRAPPIQAVQIARSSRAASGIALWTTMSASCSRPPGFNTRHASRKTASLSGARLMTPLEMTRSAVASSTGKASARPRRYSMCCIPVSATFSRPRSSMASVMSTAITFPVSPTDLAVDLLDFVAQGLRVQRHGISSCGRVSLMRASVREGRHGVGHELDGLRGADDLRARHELRVVELPPLDAGRADVDRPAIGGEVAHELLERRESLLADVVGVPVDGEADPLRREEHDRLLARAERAVGHDEAHGRPVGI